MITIFLYGLGPDAQKSDGVGYLKDGVAAISELNTNPDRVAIHCIDSGADCITAQVLLYENIERTNAVKQRVEKVVLTVLTDYFVTIPHFKKVDVLPTQSIPPDQLIQSS